MNTQNKFKTWQNKQQAKITNRPVINRRTLLGMLKTMRPHGGKGESYFIERLLSSIRRMGYTPLIDGVGNIIVNNLSTDEVKSNVMFTAHTDSVHHHESPTGFQLLEYADAERTLIGLASAEKQPTGEMPTCLGADCATGVYFMLRLLQADAKGLYCFFRQEETGGIGSDYFRNDPNNKKYWGKLTHCISFDRKGYTSIITEQWGGRCASDAFASDLSELIGLHDIDGRLDRFVADPTGSFTDSANFTDIVSECTNLSVGYFMQHSSHEKQDLVFADEFSEVLCRIDWTKLSSYRKAGWGSESYHDLSTDYEEDFSDDVYNIQSGGIDYARYLVINEPEFAAQLLLHLA